MLTLGNSKRSFSLLIAGTLLVLTYVHAQVSILQISYSIEKREKQMSLFQDEFKREKFFLARMKSPSYLNQVLKERHLDLATPKQVEVVRVLKTVEEPKLEERLPLRASANFWTGFIREAQAKTSSSK